MHIIEIGLIVSSILLVSLYLLFSYEANREIRFAERSRLRADFFVLQMAHALGRSLQFFKKDFLRQIMHYFFHRFLHTVLLCIRWCESTLQKVMHVNKKLAKSAGRENETRTKLEELTLHKVATSLTEIQKKKHKEKILKGL